MTVLKSVPRGRVATYGQIAWLAGHPGAARHVGWVLHSLSDRRKLPWQRIIGSSGRISLGCGHGFEEQRRLLRREGVAVDKQGLIDLDKYLWEPDQSELKALSRSRK